MRPAGAVHLYLGLTVWAAWFVAAYGGLSVACMASEPPREAGVFNPINVGLTVLTLATATWLLYRGRALQKAHRHLPAHASPRDRFMAAVSSCLYYVAAASTLLVGMPVLLLLPCL